MSDKEQPAANLYLLTPEQVQFITAAFKAVPLQGTAETIRPILSMMDTITAVLSQPEKADKEQHVTRTDSR
jgi:hypothetical protein